jgi:hypothetical protein
MLISLVLLGRFRYVINFFFFIIYSYRVFPAQIIGGSVFCHTHRYRIATAGS